MIKRIIESVIESPIFITICIIAGALFVFALWCCVAAGKKNNEEEDDHER